MGASFITAARIAGEQHGRITTQQLKDCGVSAKSIERAVDSRAVAPGPRGRLRARSSRTEPRGGLARGGSRRWRWRTQSSLRGDRVAHPRWGRAADRNHGPALVPPPPPGHPLSPSRSRSVRDHRMAGDPDHDPIAHDGRPRLPPAPGCRSHRVGDAAAAIPPPFHPKLLELSLHRRPNASSAGSSTASSRRDRHSRSPSSAELFAGTICPYLRSNQAHPRLHLRLPSGRTRASSSRPTARQHDDPLQRAADALRDEIHAAAGWRVLRYRWADVHRSAAHGGADSPRT